MKNQFLLIALIILTFLGCQKTEFTCESAAMEPVIKKGEIVSVDFSAYENSDPERWDIIVFTPPENIESKYWSFRVVGLPGETINYDSLGILINNKRVLSPLPHLNFRSDTYLKMKVVHPIKLAKKQYYVLGDNFDNAIDSRFIGPVPLEKIKGKVVSSK